MISLSRIQMTSAPNRKSSQRKLKESQNNLKPLLYSFGALNIHKTNTKWNFRFRWTSLRNKRKTLKPKKERITHVARFSISIPYLLFLQLIQLTEISIVILSRIRLSFTLIFWILLKDFVASRNPLLTWNGNEWIVWQNWTQPRSWGDPRRNLYPLNLSTLSTNKPEMKQKTFLVKNIFIRIFISLCARKHEISERQGGNVCVHFWLCSEGELTCFV